MWPRLLAPRRAGAAGVNPGVPADRNATSAYFQRPDNDVGPLTCNFVRQSDA